MHLDRLQGLFNQRGEARRQLDVLRRTVDADTDVTVEVTDGHDVCTCTVPAISLIGGIETILHRVETAIGAAIAPEGSERAKPPERAGCPRSQGDEPPDAPAEPQGGFWKRHKLLLARLIVARRSFDEISRTPPFVGRSPKAIGVTASKCGLLKGGAERLVAEAGPLPLGVDGLPAPLPTDSPNVKPAERTCLRCGATFDSQGPHNRMCATCRAASAGEVEGV